MAPKRFITSVSYDMRNGSKALHHFNIAKEVNRTSNTYILGGANINVLIAEAQEYIQKDINIL
jgi:hypothetical protein